MSKKSLKIDKIEDDSTDNLIVKLNIGGVRFYTSKSTLLGILGEENFFTALLNGQVPSVKDKKGYYFIDRDGEYFRPILDYLRTGQLYIPNNLEEERVHKEAQYYSINLPTRKYILSNKVRNDGIYVCTENGVWIAFSQNGECASWGYGHILLQYTIESSLITVKGEHTFPTSYLAYSDRLCDPLGHHLLFKSQTLRIGEEYIGKMTIYGTATRHPTISKVCFQEENELSVYLVIDEDASGEQWKMYSISAELFVLDQLMTYRCRVGKYEMELLPADDVLLVGLADKGGFNVFLIGK